MTTEPNIAAIEEIQKDVDTKAKLKEQTLDEPSKKTRNYSMVIAGFVLLLAYLKYVAMDQALLVMVILLAIAYFTTSKQDTQPLDVIENQAIVMKKLTEMKRKGLCDIGKMDKIKVYLPNVLIYENNQPTKREVLISITKRTGRVVWYTMESDALAPALGISIRQRDFGWKGFGVNTQPVTYGRQRYGP